MLAHQKMKGSVLVIEEGNKHAERGRNMASLEPTGRPAIISLFRYLPKTPAPRSMAHSTSFWQIQSTWASLIAEKKQEKKILKWEQESIGAWF